MNKKRRQELLSCIGKLGDVLSEIKTARETEVECFDNMPDNLRNAAEYYDKEDIIGELSMGEDNISDAIESLKKAVK